MPVAVLDAVLGLDSDTSELERLAVEAELATLLQNGNQDVSYDVYCAETRLIAGSTVADVPPISSRGVKLDTRCVLWTGAVNTEGYGQISVGGEKRLVHRLAFELFWHDPGGLKVDHLCERRRCIRHLREIDQPEHSAEHNKARNQPRIEWIEEKIDENGQKWKIIRYEDATGKKR